MVGNMERKPEEYARLLAGALCKLHAAESGGASPLLSEESVRVIRETIAAAMEDARKMQFALALAALRDNGEQRAYLHS